MWLALFMAGLVISGLTALPLERETQLLVRVAGPGTRAGALWPAMASWVQLVAEGVHETGRRYPFLPYGTDWLAFAHVAIAIAFIGAWRDPVRNAWVVHFGLIVCALVVPFALVAGAVRGIPLWWRTIDCSFGVIGGVPLLVCRRLIARLGVMIRAVDEDKEYEELVCILEPFRKMRIKTGPVTLTDEYLRMVEEVESAPENQSGADKTAVEVVFRQSREHFAGARRSR